jgi:hypothetical protein
MGVDFIFTLAGAARGRNSSLTGLRMQSDELQSCYIELYCCVSIHCFTQYILVFSGYPCQAKHPNLIFFRAIPVTDQLPIVVSMYAHGINYMSTHNTGPRPCT